MSLHQTAFLNSGAMDTLDQGTLSWGWLCCVLEDACQHPWPLSMRCQWYPLPTTPTQPWQSVQFSWSVVSDSVTPWTAAHQASLSITNPQSLLKLMSIESVMLSNHLILCCPLLLLPSIFARIRLFSNESVLRIRRPDYWSFSFSISPSLNIHWNIHDNKISLNMATCSRRSKISPFKNHGHRWAKRGGMQYSSSEKLPRKDDTQGRSWRTSRNS